VQTSSRRRHARRPRACTLCLCAAARSHCLEMTSWTRELQKAHMRTVPAAIPGRHLTDGKRDLAVRILSTQPATARARSPPLAGLEHGKYNIAAIGQRPFIIPLHFSSIPTETRYHKWARLRTLTSGQGSERSQVGKAQNAHKWARLRTLTCAPLCHRRPRCWRTTHCLAATIRLEPVHCPHPALEWPPTAAGAVSGPPFLSPYNTRSCQLFQGLL
jgi:hypothetical protein